MEKIIYSRFSNERASEFNICTQILENQSGEKKIKKRAYQKEGQKHIDRIYDSYLKFGELYKDSIFKPNNCLNKNGVLEFEFLNGQNLEGVLDQLILEEKFEEARQLILKYVEELKKAHVDGKFSMSEQFEEVFGNVNLVPDLDSSSYSNIDLIFQNIIIVGEKWNIIDYEWTFDFPIPINYVIYRALFYFEYENPERCQLVNEQLYREIGIEPDQILCYRLMESNFQKYIQKGYVPLRDRIVGYHTKEFMLDDLVEEKIAQQKHDDIQAYFDYGQGFSEEKSKIYTGISDAYNTLEVEIDISKDVCALRLDPAMHSCAIQIKELEALDEYWYDVGYTCNGYKIDENTVLFDTQDPQITISEFRDNTTKVRAVIKFFSYDKELSKNIVKIIEKKEYEKNETKKYYEQSIIRALEKKNNASEYNGDNHEEELIKKLQNQIETMQREKNEYLRVISAKDKVLCNKEKMLLEKENQINQIVNSRTWRLKEKIHKIGHLFQK